MKIIMHGPAAGYGWDGTIHSWAPDQVVEVDDSNAKAVAWARARVAEPIGELLEDVKTPSREPSGSKTGRKETI